MLSLKEEKFLDNWKRDRAYHSRFSSKLLGGLPMAMIFALPILLLILSVYLFLPDWYTKISGTSAQTFVVIIIAILIFIFFFSIARMHFKWEMNEQLYLELKHKQKKYNTTSQLLKK